MRKEPRSEQIKFKLKNVEGKEMEGERENLKVERDARRE
jgi:hypothetical protein